MMAGRVGSNDEGAMSSMTDRLARSHRRMMMQVLSFGEIEQRYDGEWVLIAYTELDENLKPIAGEVIAHSINRDVVYDAIAHRGVAIECFVKVPVGTGVTRPVVARLLVDTGSSYTV
jgi:hypothetical protein